MWVSELDIGDTEKLIAQIKSVVESGFQSRTLPAPNLCNQDEKLLMLVKLGVETYNRWLCDQLPETLHAAESFFAKVLDNSNESSIPVHLQAMVYIGLISIASGAYKSGIGQLKEVINICEEKILVGQLHAMWGQLYQDLFVLKCMKKHCVQYEAQADSLDSMLSSLRRIAVAFDGRYRGEPLEPRAYRVGQGEMGISAEELLGVDNVRTCICVLLHEPDSKRTAVAHIDCVYRAESLIFLVNRLLAPGSPGRCLHARLLGARTYPGKGFNTFNLDDSKRLLKKVCAILSDYPIKLVSADIFESNQPSCLVVEPTTFAISEQVPGLLNRDRHIINASVLFGNPREMHLAFDLTVSKCVFPMIILRKGIEKLRNFIGKDANELYVYLGNMFVGVELLIIVEGIVDLIESWHRSLMWVCKRLDEQVAKLVNSGIQVLGDDISKAVRLVFDCPIGILHGAEIINQILLDIFVHKFFCFKEGHAFFCDWAVLENFEFPGRAYEIIEAGVRIPDSNEAQFASLDGNAVTIQT